MSRRRTAYDLLAGDFDLSSDIKQEAPPYVPTAPPTYKLKAVRKPKHLSIAPPFLTLIMVSPQHVPRGLRLHPIDDHHSPGIGPNDASKFLSSAPMSPRTLTPSYLNLRA